MEEHHVHRRREAAEESTGCSHSSPRLGTQRAGCNTERAGRAPSPLKTPISILFYSTAPLFLPLVHMWDKNACMHSLFQPHVPIKAAGSSSLRVSVPPNLIKLCVGPITNS